jgi:PAS domain S-box-containing protein
LSQKKKGASTKGIECKDFQDTLQKENSILKEMLNETENMHLVYLDNGFNFVRVNEAYAKTCGYKTEEMIGKNHFRLYPSEEIEAIFKRVRDAGVPAKFHDKPFVFPDQLGRGVTYWDWTLKPIKNEAGKVEGLVFSLVETTERKKIEEEIRNLAKFPSENPNPVLRIDRNGYFLYCNNAARQRLKSSKCNIGEVVPKRWHKFVDAAFTSGKRQEFEEQIAGRTFVFAMSPVNDYINVYGLDITKRKKAEEELRKSERRYRSFIEVTGELGWTTNAEGEILEDMPSWRNFTGQTYQEIKGSGWSNALHPDDLENALRLWRKAIQEKNKYEIEYRIRRHDGVYRYFMARGVPVFGEDASLREWVGTCIDITERKEAEDKLQEQSVAIASAPDAIYSTNNQFVIRSWNKAAESIFGWKTEEVTGKATTSIFNIKYPTLNGVSREQASKKLMDTGYWKGEVIYHKKNGSPIPVAVSISLVKDKNDNVSGTVAVVHDISKRKRREKVMRRSLEVASNKAEELAKLMDIIPAAVWISRDSQCANIIGNQAANSLYESSSGENVSAGLATGISQDNSRRFFKDDRELKPEELPMQVAAAKNVEVRDSELDVVLPGGKTMTMLGNAKPLLNNEGKVRGCVAAFIDITERKKDLEALRMSEWIARNRTEELEKLQVELEKKAAEVQKYATQMQELAEERALKLKDAERLAAIGATAGMVGHDIRNPLQSIDGELYLITSEASSLPECEMKENIKESVSNIREGVAYINKIVQDLQDYSKPLMPNLQKTNFEEICKTLLSGDSFPENINTKYVVEDEAKEFVTDPTLLQRILSNLINNAVQAMPNGGALEIQARRESGEVVITVKDTGVGISEEYKDKLFTPLFTTKAKGQGFGLAVVKRMTEVLGGAVTFESKTGKGTKFVVRFPTAEK